jgi:hypothetical protein
LEIELVLFPRAFIRKRVISLATTASVAAISFVSAQDTTKTHHIRREIQHVADRQAEQALVSESSAATHRMMADMTIKPIRDIDRDLVEMRGQRHQAAAEMARESSKGAVTRASPVIAEATAPSSRNRIRLAVRSTMAE